MATETRTGEELAPRPTREEAEAANAGELALRGITKAVLDTAKKHPFLAGSSVLAIGGLVAGAVAAIEASQNNTPGVHESVPANSSFNNNPEKPSARDVFDPTAREGVIKPSMIPPQEEIDRLFPTPFGKIKDHNTVQVPPNLINLSKSENPNTPIKFERKFSDPYITHTFEQDKKLEQQGFFNALSTPMKELPKGGIITAPVSGWLYLLPLLYSPEPDSAPLFNGVAIVFQEENGNTYRMLITGASKNTASVFIPLLAGTPILNPKQYGPGVPIETNAIYVQRFSQILQASEDISLNVRVFGKEGIVGRTFNPLNPSIPVNMELISIDNMPLDGKK